MLVVTMITSMYFFPFEFTFLPGANTKMIMAGLGLVWFGINMAKGTQEGGLNRDLFNLSIWAMGISLISIAPTIIHLSPMWYPCGCGWEVLILLPD